MTMRLATIRTLDGTQCVRVDHERAVETGHRCVGELLAEPEWRAVAAGAEGAEHGLDDLDYAPLVPHAEKVICVGLNYADHIAETGRPAPTHPTLFPKFARTLIGAHDAIALPDPDESVQNDWEAELGVVIGAPVRRASAEDAAAAIAGYTVVNDFSVRDWQFSGGQFMPGKAWEGTAPVGPHLVVANGLEAAHFPIECEVNGTVMQSSNTRELVFTPIDLIRHISTFVTLVPGDLIATGTPGGVGVARDPQVFLRRGDVVVTRIAGIGECRNVCS